MIDASISTAVIRLLFGVARHYWPCRKLADLIELSNGKAMTKGMMVPSGPIPVYGANGLIGATDKALVFFSTITIGRVGSCGEVNMTEELAWVSDNAMWVSKIDDGLDLTYLYFLLRSLPLAEGAKIAAMPSISQSHVLRETVPLPPLREQLQIGAFLLDFSQGKSGWKNNDLPPPLATQRGVVVQIEEMAAQINEARLLHQQAIEEAQALVNAQFRMTADSLTKRYGTVQLGKLITDAGYGSSRKCSAEREEAALPVLRIPNVASEAIDLDNLKFARLSAREEEHLLLASGDVLIVRTNGSSDLVGRSAVVDTLPEPMAFASYMIRLRFNRVIILPEYAQRMLRHLRMSGQLVDFARTTAGQFNVSLGRLRSAEIPVPPIYEQRRTIAYLDDLQNQADTVRALQAETSAELDALIPSILDKAFRGELLPDGEKLVKESKA